MEEFIKIITNEIAKNGTDPYFAYPHCRGYSLEEMKEKEYYPFVYALNIQNKILFPDEKDQTDLEVHRFCWENKIREYNENWITGFARFVQKCDAIELKKRSVPNDGFGATINFMKHDDDAVGSLFTDKFIAFCKSKEIKNYYIAIEYGKNNNNPHAHVYLDYYDRRRCGGGTGLNDTAKPRSLRYELHKFLTSPTDIQVQHNPRLGAWYQYCKKPESEKKTFFERLHTHSEDLA